MEETPLRRAVLLASVAALAAVGGLHPSEAATAQSPCAQFDATKRTDPVLGNGMTLSTPYPANLVPAGSPPVVTLTVPTPSTGTLTYTVTRRSKTLLSTSVPPAAGALRLPDAGPGAYQVEARLMVAGVQVGGTCLRYGVAMPGSTLDMTDLPAGADWGGPGAEREVVLQKALGGSISRRQVSFATVQTNPGSYDETFRAASARAKTDGMLLDVQVGQGGAAERAAINSGAWEQGVRSLVSRQKGVVPYWEAWNEPNFDYFFTGTATDYVNKVLKPFSRAVHESDPDAKVVGGSTYGTDIGWWTAFAKAGGFNYLDVVAVHAYMWDTMWEKTSMVSDLKQLVALKAKYGAAAKPLWDTESGYRSLSEAGGPWAQADDATHKMLWERTLGIPTQSYQVEGGWEDWSVIDQGRGVKPAAMALSTYATVLDGRKFVGMVSTGIKNVYAARFGSQTSGGNGMIAIWTDGHAAAVPLRTSHSVVDEVGGTQTFSRTLPVGSSVQYVSFAPGGQIL
jgi:hypothetical protein